MITGVNNAANQSELEANTCEGRQARENAYEQVTRLVLVVLLKMARVF